MMLGLVLTKLVIVGEAKAIYMALAGDGKSEIGPTEGILETHTAPTSPGFQQHTLGDQESLCKEEAARVSDRHRAFSLPEKSLKEARQSHPCYRRGNSGQWHSNTAHIFNSQEKKSLSGT